jgi:hypothetical protein
LDPVVANSYAAAPPAADEFEVTLFGPGFGECVLIHVGNNEWLVVDSCVDVTDSSRTPMALRYLRDLGLNASEVVKVIAASHWHDDHIRGISSIVEICPDADFICSAAIGHLNFLQLVAAQQNIVQKIPSGTSEFKKIIELRSNDKKRPTPVYAMANMPLWSSASGTARIFSLSPSSASFEASLVDLSKIVREVSQTRRLVPVHSENGSTVVLWIDFGVGRILLGGDLECPSSDLVGWRGIVKSQLRPVGRAGVYKVAHHGSEGAHLDGIWSELLETRNISLIAPWRNGSGRLPLDRDLARIADLSEKTFLTASPELIRSPKRPQSTRRLIDHALKTPMRSYEPPLGWVRLRTRDGQDWTVELGPDATDHSI